MTLESKWLVYRIFQCKNRHISNPIDRHPIKSSMAVNTKRFLLEENSNSAENRDDFDMFSDFVCVFCLCSETQKCLLVQNPEKGGGWWLPHVRVKPTDSWNEAANFLVTTALDVRNGPENEKKEEMEVHPQLFHIKRCFFPMSIPKATVVTFLVTTDSTSTSTSKLDQTKRWFSTDDVFEMAIDVDNEDDFLLGSEPLQYFAKLHEGKSFGDVEEVFSETKMGNDHDNDEEPAKKKRLTAVKELLSSANYGMKERELLYVAFMFKVFPRTEMCGTVFKREMETIGWPKHTTPSLFQAFDQKQCNFLSFRDFMMGSAITETCTQHGGPPAEIRCRSIFRYYNEDGDGRLKFREFRRMVSDIKRIKGEPLTDDDALDTAAKADYQLFSKTPNESLSLPDFLFTVGKLRFRGTSCLLRFENLFQSFLATTNISTKAEERTKNGTKSEENL